MTVTEHIERLSGPIHILNGVVGTVLTGVVLWLGSTVSDLTITAERLTVQVESARTDGTRREVSISANTAMASALQTELARRTGDSRRIDELERRLTIAEAALADMHWPAVR